MFDDQNIPLTPVSQLGEFGLIRKLTEKFTIRNSRHLKGPGDDCAVIDSGNGEVELITTDMLLEGVHFDLAYVPLKHLGYKCVAVNVSDICAMNGVAEGITVSIAMSSRFSVEALEELYEGIRIACEAYQIDLLGGDTCSSRTGLVISVTAIGRAVKEEVAYRSGAQVNDLLCVTGDLGAAYAGLQILEREKKVFIENPGVQPDLARWDYVVGRQLKPEARPDIIRLLKERGVKPNAMIDVSDGLSSDLKHICAMSQKGASVFQNKLPIDHQTGEVANLFRMHPSTYALNGGEDYELLFTVPVQDFDKLKDLREVYIIGHITDPSEGVRLIGERGEVYEMEAQGWNHFSK